MRTRLWVKVRAVRKSAAGASVMGATVCGAPVMDSFERVKDSFLRRQKWVDKC